jgi:hypothetical protein
MSYMIEHAKREFARILDSEPDKEYKIVASNVMINVVELMKTFGKQGHSISTAAEVIRLFSTLAMFEPLTPLTGSDDEWSDVAPGVRQNIRCPRVFSRLEAGRWKAYDNAGKVFRDKEGVCYNGKESRVPVEFPYTPVTEYIDVMD